MLFNHTSPCRVPIAWTGMSLLFIALWNFFVWWQPSSRRGKSFCCQQHIQKWGYHFSERQDNYQYHISFHQCHEISRWIHQQDKNKYHQAFHWYCLLIRGLEAPKPLSINPNTVENLNLSCSLFQYLCHIEINRISFPLIWVTILCLLECDRYL